MGPLAGLPALQALDFTANRVVDAAPLAGLAALEFLILDENLVEEVLAIECDKEQMHGNSRPARGCSRTSNGIRCPGL